MSETVDVFWSFRSPYSRLVTPDLLQLPDDYDVDVQLRVVLPLAVRNPQALFDPSNRKPPMYIARDSIRRGEMLGRPVVLPADPDPIVQDFRTMEVAKEQPYIYRLSKLGVEANRRGRGVEFADRVAALAVAGQLSKALNVGKAAAETLGAKPSLAVNAARARLDGVPEAKLDYLALVDPSSFELIDDSFTGRALMLIAAVVGSTRLIDNLTIDFQEPFA